ncbi:MAG: glucosylceramidase [Chloroflexi bacterium]|nr:glucosylceramidase [Chloroflexota bacterium]
MPQQTALRHAQLPLPIAWTRAIGEPFLTPWRLAPGQEHQIDDGYWQGLPLGGLGSGSIGRTYRGDFARWHLDVGRHRYRPADANHFAVRVSDGRTTRATTLTTWRPTDVLSGWEWHYPAGHGYYQALFPQAYFVYDPDVLGVALRVRQFSPVLPHNYRESSYPVAVFEYEAHNHREVPIEVSLLFTWENTLHELAGSPPDRPFHHTARAEGTAPDTLVGVVLDREDVPAFESWHGQFAIAAGGDATLSACSGFPISANGAPRLQESRALWDDFVSDGRLDALDERALCVASPRLGAAVAATVQLGPGETRRVPFFLCWDLPIMQFGSGTRWYRRYTRFFGQTGQNAWAMCREAYARYRAWGAAIDEWQRPILEATDRPDWYKVALFNELYYLVDGGTAWEDGRVGSTEDTPGHFGYLECFDYPFYETLDVRFYASFPLLAHWPELEKQVMRDFATTVPREDARIVTIQASGKQACRKVAGAVPHDLGAPDDDPWQEVNAYRFQDVNVWKDLNAKFALLVYRDFRETGDRSFLVECWPAVRAALDYLGRFDHDGDGLPENEGIPDQTYDTWPMRGPSAYCGMLWLAALLAGEEIARQCGDAAAADACRRLFVRGQESLERILWHGAYYDFDALSEHHDSIMADQLCGQWYATALGLPRIVSSERARVALRRVYERNVMGFMGGTLGAVNGVRPSGEVDQTSDQSQEVWSGVTYALAALMIQEGMPDEAFRTTQGAVLAVYQRSGLWFRTPEAWDASGHFRAAMYLRPQAIWAMELALRDRGRQANGDV